jgi:putative DNA primase/helicase
MTENALRQFAQAIAAVGLTPPQNFVADGALHRFASSGKAGDDAGYYVFHAGDIPLGSFGCFRSGIKRRWRFDIGRRLTEDELRARVKTEIEDRKRRQEEREFDPVASAMMADDAWVKAYPAKRDHPYLVAKGIQPHHARQWAGRLVIPLWNGEQLESLQYIDAGGEKRFLRKARVDGLFTSFGTVEGDSPIACLAEGFATAATIFEVTGLPTLAAMSANNLPLAAKRIRQLFPGAQLVICADDDEHKDGKPNIGIQKAAEAARAVCGEVATPDFGDSRRAGDTDFNDLAARRGADVVKTIINAAKRAIESRKFDMQAAIERLATLSIVEREQQRKAVAKQFGVRASVVDAAVAKIATDKASGGKGRAVAFRTAEPWPEPVNGVVLLDEITAQIRKYVIVSRHGAAAAALWILQTYLMDVARIAARLLVSAPEKGCGKTRLVEVVDRLVHKPMSVSNITAAALFRSIEAWAPTLLIDEFDSFGKDDNDIRNIVNSGHSHAAAFALRTEGDAHEPQLFSTWAPILIAMIGLPKGTILDRSITIKLQRKTRSETVAKLRHGQDDDAFQVLRQKIARFALDHNAALRLARPATPDALSDRQQDNWELLFAIADAAAGDWPKRAREAAVYLSGQPLNADSMATQLLADVRAAFCHADTDRLTSAQVIEALTADETSVWNAFPRDKPITQPLLAKMLRRFEVTPGVVREGSERARGYKRGVNDKRLDDADQTLSPLENAFSRYLPPCEGVTCDKSISTGDVTEKADVTCKRCHVCKLRDKTTSTGDVTCHGTDAPNAGERTEGADDDVVETF